MVGALWALLVAGCGGTAFSAAPGAPESDAGAPEGGEAAEAAVDAPTGSQEAGDGDAVGIGPTLCCAVGQNLIPCGDPDAGFADCPPPSPTHAVGCTGALGAGVVEACGP